MKLTNTLRTIAFSGLGLLAGASTVTMSAQDAHALSSPIYNIPVRTELGLNTLLATAQVLGEIKVEGSCRQQKPDNLSYINFMTIHRCPGQVEVEIENEETGDIIYQAVLDLVDGRYATSFEHHVPASVVYHIRYLGGEDAEGRQFLPSYLTSKKALICSAQMQANSEPDLTIDDIDQNCDGVDGLNEDGDGFASVEVGGTDCDDNDASTYPGAEDLYGDGIDQDCSGADGIDLDGDGFAAASVGGPDCDDSNPLFHPDALDDVGDDLDQNCDGLDGVDADRDGYASIESLGSDCDDLEAMTHIGSADTVGDLVDNNCDGVDGVDRDQDGHASTLSGGTDCDDSVATTYLGAADSVGDAVDNNCDGIDGVDADQDGHVSTQSGGTDCNDSLATTYSGAADVVGDLVDNNCDGVDGVDADRDGHASTQSGGTDCDDSVATTYLGAADIVGDSVDSNCDGVDGADADRDGYASTLSGGTDCDDSVATTYPGAADSAGDAVDNNCDGVDGVDADRDGQASNQSGGTDCDDANATIYTGSIDSLGDNVDSNCDGVDGVDLDQDGYRTIASGGNDCDDSDASINPAQLDRVDADEIDSNCDGTDGVDADFDGIASMASGGQDCNDRDATVYPSADELEGDSKDSNCDGLDDPDLDADSVSSERDCDDLNASVYPGAKELVGDGLDNNCDGRIDELYLDRDGDGFGAMDEGGTDCDDYNAEAYPNAEEILDDGIDQDCDGVDDVEVLGVYRDLLRVHDKLSQVSCIVIEDYKTVDCFEQNTLRTVMRRTFEFEGRLKDIAFSWLRTSGCALSDRGELTCWNDSSSDSNSWPISFSQDSYEEATSLIRGQSGAICVAGRDGILECSGELSAGSWDDRKLTIPGQDTYVGHRNQGLPSYLRVRANEATSVDGLMFGSYFDDASQENQWVTRDDCGLVFTDSSLIESNLSEALVVLPSIMCLPNHMPEVIEYSNLDSRNHIAVAQTPDNWLVTWTDGQSSVPTFVPEPMKVQEYLYDNGLVIALLDSGKLRAWNTRRELTENLPAQYR